PTLHIRKGGGVNSLKLDDPLSALSQLQDCSAADIFPSLPRMLPVHALMQKLLPQPVVTLLLYYASMSDKIPREWATVEHDLQVTVATCFSAPDSCPLDFCFAWLPSPPLFNVFEFLAVLLLPPGASASPVGDVMQTPQFQVRRLKKLLEAERENRDDLERELAEARKLLDEKGAAARPEPGVAGPWHISPGRSLWAGAPACVQAPCR
uniref:Uncharacterized protein n=1 Tax=Varanus komodoensis TaxID=61221 RepID=A0A8D2LH03_VARKO